MCYALKPIGVRLSKRKVNTLSLVHPASLACYRWVTFHPPFHFLDPRHQSAVAIAVAKKKKRDNERRRDLRKKLARARTVCPLFDTQRWVRDAEHVLRWAWERHEARLPPAHYDKHR